MNSQQQNNQQGTFMPDGDMMYTILADLKRTVGEYTTATTEAACPAVRSMFTNLLNHSLQIQGDLYNYMQQNNMYDKPSPALKQAIDKEMQLMQQTQQQTQQFVSQKQAQNFQPQANAQAAQTSNNPYYF
ncbi:spore coat protein [Paenibacillus selenitireducens]|nr:spore coat protein [Paenibacillus selenitireducens]